MKVLLPFFITLFIYGCETTSTTVIRNADHSNDALVNENFETMAVGEFNATDPWYPYTGGAVYMSNHITDQGCIEGERCLKTKSLYASGDPDYSSYVQVRNKIENMSGTIYLQCYFKYTYPDSGLYMEWALTGGVMLRINKDTGIYLFDKSSNERIIVQPGNIAEGVWYRVEMMMQKTSGVLFNIRIYKENETIPVSGSTGESDIPIYTIEQQSDKTYNSAIYMLSEYLYNNVNPNQDPETDLEPFAWYLDDIRIGYDQNETLLVGF
jgi:hypothetical protein